MGLTHIETGHNNRFQSCNCKHFKWRRLRSLDLSVGLARGPDFHYFYDLLLLEPMHLQSFSCLSSPVCFYKKKKGVSLT